jgi:hypothetical protein
VMSDDEASGRKMPFLRFWHSGHGPVTPLENLPRNQAELPDCVAGHVGLELRNVTAKYAFERSYRFLVIHRISKIPRGPWGV